MQSFSQDTEQISGLAGSSNYSTASVRKPFFIIVLIIFLVTLGIGFWLGKVLVINDGNQSANLSFISEHNPSRSVIALLQVNDLTEEDPELISIWFMYLTGGDSPKAGFTPVASRSLPDEPTYSLLTEFSVDEEHIPSRKFIESLGKIKVTTSGYILVDHKSITSILKWFAGKEAAESLSLEENSMAEYGQVLRTFCHSLSGETERPDFPWSLALEGHFKTSLSFEQVFSNLAFLINQPSPQCIMVPMP